MSVEKLPVSTANQARISTYAADRAALLLGCYRTGDANDPETYVAAIAATLARYSAEIITSVTHPVDGLPGKLAWLPKICEVREACEAEAAVVWRRTAAERRLRAQMQERIEVEAVRTEPRPTLADMKAKYGENWGLEPDGPAKPLPRQAPSWDRIAEMYADPIDSAHLAKHEAAE